MHRASQLLAVLVALAAPASEAAPAAQAQSNPKPERPQDKIVCKFVNSTGSRLSGTRECRTRAEWERASADAQDDIDHMEKRATGNPVDDSGSLIKGPH
jgi:hypothetical protein